MSKRNPLKAFIEYHEKVARQQSKQHSPIVCAYGFDNDLISKMSDYTGIRNRGFLDLHLKPGRSLLPESTKEYLGQTALCIVCNAGRNRLDPKQQGHAYACLIEGEIFSEIDDGSLDPPYACTIQPITCNEPLTHIHRFHIVCGPNPGEYAIKYDSFQAEVKRMKVFFVTTVDPTDLTEAKLFALLSCPWQYIEMEADCLEYAKGFAIMLADACDPNHEGLLLDANERAALLSLTLDGYWDQTSRPVQQFHPLVHSALGRSSTATLFAISCGILVAVLVLFATMAGAVVFGLSVYFKYFHNTINSTIANANASAMPREL